MHSSNKNKLIKQLKVVWASSDEVGCGASNKCGGDYKTHIVCQYLPR